MSQRWTALLAACGAALLGGPPDSAMAEPAPATRSAVADRDCSHFATQKAAQKFFLSHDPARDPHRLDGDRDQLACETRPCPCYAQRYDNGEWVAARSEGTGIPERPFELWIDGLRIGSARLVTFASRVSRTRRFPQVLALASSGYLRLKSGADPRRALPFGQSLVLGPAVFGTSTSFPNTTLFFNPQVERVVVDTGGLKRNGTGTLLIRVSASDRNLAAADTHSNQIMDINWQLELFEPSNGRTRLRATGEYRFTERFVPDATRTSEYQSFRLLQVSSMFIDAGRHDVDGFRYRDAAGPVEELYAPGQVNTLRPPSPSPLAPGSPVLDSVHTDDAGMPNGNTPSHRITLGTTTGPVSGPLTPRAFFNDSQDLNDDNLGLWVHQQPAGAIRAGTVGTIRFGVVATADPLPPP